MQIGREIGGFKRWGIEVFNLQVSVSGSAWVRAVVKPCCLASSPVSPGFFIHVTGLSPLINTQLSNFSNDKSHCQYEIYFFRNKDAFLSWQQCRTGTAGSLCFCCLLRTGGCYPELLGWNLAKKWISEIWKWWEIGWSHGFLFSSILQNCLSWSTVFLKGTYDCVLLLRAEAYLNWLIAKPIEKALSWWEWPTLNTLASCKVTMFGFVCRKDEKERCFSKSEMLSC